MQCIMLGYATGAKTYRSLNLSTNKIITCRDASFDEAMFPKTLKNKAILKNNSAASSNSNNMELYDISNSDLSTNSDASETYTHTFIGPYNPRTSSAASNEVIEISSTAPSENSSSCYEVIQISDDSSSTTASQTPSGRRASDQSHTPGSPFGYNYNHQGNMEPSQNEHLDIEDPFAQSSPRTFNPSHDTRIPANITQAREYLANRQQPVTPLTGQRPSRNMGRHHSLNERLLSHPHLSTRLDNVDFSYFGGVSPGYLSDISGGYSPESITPPITPSTWNQAMSLPDADLWRDATDKEMKSLSENYTWLVCKLPPGKRPIKVRWVFKIKKHTDGTIDKYKARLVAKGCVQVPGVDFHETYAPVLRFTSFRTLMAIAATHDLEVDHTDANNAFLNGTINEELYIELPDGYNHQPSNNSDTGSMVGQLHKALYMILSKLHISGMQLSLKDVKKSDFSKLQLNL
ncbi:hypothetical protein BASA50_001051 [Batrachochytrium salamandrivorans]|uniref:Reverse transcriptase Ty1/copia-type domain-containing protein n=1 Tax=Batrachochytrium salamandrivorans TaxID=1357716 RepID=A0ABQ8ESI8_9FUNG|nr:hypothetical protein BASA50_001051 [Batrachochytrium salamandrivorans]KAH6588220.1 hypothetical protein BASA61_006029 [Batrachochytrium salamandrivorans]